MCLVVALIVLIVLILLMCRSSKEGYGNAIFKIDSRRPPGEQGAVCDYQYADCLHRAKEGTYSVNYCKWLHNMCSGAACMSPY